MQQSSDDIDPWAWAREESADQAVDTSHLSVTAVLVTRDGADWLDDALASLASLTVRPARLIAVDNGSSDGSLAILQAAATAGQITEIVAGDAGWGFGQAVAAGLETPTGSEKSDFLWLLHDDVVARPDVLQRLLDESIRSPQSSVFGPTLLHPSRRNRAPVIAELGVSISDTGRRELGLEPGEIVQGQHDPTAVLGVSTCGLLVRRDAFELIGGLAPEVPLFRDGVEFGWRANLAGQGVLTVPRAAMVHRQAGRRGLRRMALPLAGTRSPAALDRFLGMRVVAAHSRWPMSWLVSLRLVFGTFLRALGYLVGKAPEAARDELGALALFVTGAAGTSRLRRRAQNLHPTTGARALVRTLRPGPWSSWAVGAETVGRGALDRLRHYTGTDSDTSIDELTGDDFADQGSHNETVLPVAIGVGSLLVVLAAGRALLRPGWITSSGLLRAPASIGSGIRDYIAAVPGLRGSAPGWQGLAAVGSIIGITPNGAAFLALLLALPLATLAAVWFLRPLVGSARIRWLAALAYGLLPALVGGLGRGEVWIVVWAVLLPMFGVVASRWQVVRTGIQSWRPAAGGAVVLTVLTAIAPVAWLLGAATVIVLVVRRGGASRALLTLGAPILLLAPWLPRVAAYPGRLLTGPEPLLADPGSSGVWQLFLARSAGPALPPLWVSFVVVGAAWLAAAIAIALRSDAVKGWAAALGLVGLAIVCSRLLVTVAGGSARPAVEHWLLAAVGVLILTSALGLDAARSGLEGESFGVGQGLVVGTAAISAVALVIGLGWWVLAGVSTPLERSDTESLPPFVLNSETSARQTRTLIITMDGESPAWLLHEAGGSRWGDAETGLCLPADPAARRLTEQVVAQLASGRQDEAVATSLATLGVGHVFVSGAAPELRTVLGSTPGLQGGADTAAGALWVVTAKPTRIQLVSGTSVTQLATGQDATTGGTLLLSSPPDDRWVVRVGGAVLAPLTSPDWRAAYAVGDARGPVTVTMPASPAVAWLQLAGLVLLLGLAAPTVSAPTAEPAAARRAAGQEGVPA